MEQNLYSKSGKKSYHNHNHNQYSVPTSYSAGALWTSDDLGNQPQFNPQFMVRSGSSYSSHDSALDVHSPSQPMYRHDSQSSNSTGYNNPAYSPADYTNPNFPFEQNNNYFPAATNNYPVQQPPILANPFGPTWATPRTDLASYDQLLADSPSSPMSPMQSNGYVLGAPLSHIFSLPTTCQHTTYSNTVSTNKAPGYKAPKHPNSAA